MNLKYGLILACFIAIVLFLLFGRASAFTIPTLPPIPTLPEIPTLPPVPTLFGEKCVTPTPTRVYTPPILPTSVPTSTPSPENNNDSSSNNNSSNDSGGETYRPTTKGGLPL